MRYPIFRAAMGVVAALFMVGCAHFTVTEAIWYNPGYAAMAPKAIHELASNAGYTVEYKAFHGADGTLLYGLLLSRPGNTVTVLKFGGDSFQTGSYGLEAGELFESLHVNAFLVDYRGYGMSEGKSESVDTMMSDAVAAYDFLNSDASIQGTAIAVDGLSLGSFVAPYVANHRPVSALILESTATNVSDWAHNQIPLFAKPFVHIDIAASLQGTSNVKALERYHGPLLLLAGARDKITPAKFSRELYQKSSTPAAMKRLYIADDQGHGTVLSNPQARAEYMKFLDEVVTDNQGE